MKKRLLSFVTMIFILSALMNFPIAATAEDNSFYIVSAKLDAENLEVTFTFSEEVHIFNKWYIYFCTRPSPYGEIKDNGTVIGHDQYPISSVKYIDPTSVDGIDYSYEVVIAFDKPEDESDFMFKKDDPAAPEQAGVRFIEGGLEGVTIDGVISTKSIATADGKGLRANTYADGYDACWAPCEGWGDAMESRNLGYIRDLVADDIIIESPSKAMDGYYTYYIRWNKAVIAYVNPALIGSVTVPSVLGKYPVTAIGEHAFADCWYITDVVIPEGVTLIDEYAFGSCNNIKSVKLPETLETLGAAAFWRCLKLTDVNIPASVTSIERNPFTGCESLSNLTVDENNAEYYVTDNGTLIEKATKTLIRMGNGTFIPDDGSVAIIGDIAFEYLENITSITIPDTVTHIKSAFISCTNLTKVSIPDSVKYIGNDAFTNCEKLEDITIPESVEYIGPSAFFGCAELENIILPSKIKAIDEFTFTFCSNLKSIVIPNGVKTIGMSAFRECPSLTDIYFMGTKNEWDSITKGEKWALDAGDFTVHYVDTSWTADDSNHWHKCSECDDIVGKAEHTVKNGFCTVCERDCRIVGDVDGEYGLTANDAIYLLYNVFFGESEYPLNQPCNFDSIGSVTANDAIYLLYHVFFGEETYPLN